MHGQNSKQMTKLAQNRLVRTLVIALVLVFAVTSSWIMSSSVTNARFSNLRILLVSVNAPAESQLDAYRSFFTNESNKSGKTLDDVIMRVEAVKGAAPKYIKLQLLVNDDAHMHATGDFRLSSGTFRTS